MRGEQQGKTSTRGPMTPLLDPRNGDVEDDTSSTKGRSLLSLAGTLLVEISLPKLVAAWLLLVALPCFLLGLTPLIGSAWLHTFSRTAGSTYGGSLAFALILDRARDRMVRRAHDLPCRGAGVLGTQCDGGAAIICTVPGVHPTCCRACARTLAGRGEPGAAARSQCGCRRADPVRDLAVHHKADRSTYALERGICPICCRRSV